MPIWVLVETILVVDVFHVLPTHLYSFLRFLKVSLTLKLSAGCAACLRRFGDLRKNKILCCVEHLHVTKSMMSCRVSSFARWCMRAALGRPDKNEMCWVLEPSHNNEINLFL